MRISTVLITVVIMLVESSAIAGAEAYPYELAIESLFMKWNRPDSPGAAVVVVKDSVTVYKNEFGSANLEYNIPISDTTIFHVGSVSKQFTAFSILMLEDRKKLSLDDSIIKFLPELKPLGDSITIRHLLHHLSGLREQEHLLQICGISSADNISTEQILRLIGRQEKLNFAPGDEIEYCNTGYVLLAVIVERVTGQSLRDWTSRNIFEPLGMSSSRFFDDNTRIVKNRAYPYWEPDMNSGIVKGILNYSFVGPTGLFTTSEDMAKWLANMETGKVGNKRILERLKTETGRLNNGEDITYGFGIGVTEYKGLKVILHSGHDAGYRAFDAYFPEQKLGIAILSNFYSLNPGELGYRIADIILAALLADSEETAGSDNGEVESEENARVVHISEVDCTGKYYSKELETTYTIVVDNDKLMAEHWRNPDVIMTRVDIDRFTGDQWWFEDILFTRDSDGEITGFNLTTGRVRNLRFDRCE